MSIVNNGRISVTDQKVDTKKYDDNFDEINWKSKRSTASEAIEDIAQREALMNE